MKAFKPMLAGRMSADMALPHKLMWASPKYDGIRALVRGGKLLSRSLKRIPNKFIRSILEHPQYEGLDGELVVGSTFQSSTSGIMTSKGEPDFAYFVFDLVTKSPLPFSKRYEILCDTYSGWASRLRLVFQAPIGELKQLKLFHHRAVERGHEGTVIRNPNAPYKYGRSTVKEGILLKLVDYHTDEGAIVGFTELQHNNNDATIDHLGHTKRSSHKANKAPGGVLGAFVLKNENYRERFEVGTGFTAAQRAHFWRTRGELKGKLVRFKHKPFGQLDKPRHAVFQGFRDLRDL